MKTIFNKRFIKNLAVKGFALAFAVAFFTGCNTPAGSGVNYFYTPSEPALAYPLNNVYLGNPIRWFTSEHTTTAFTAADGEDVYACGAGTVLGTGVYETYTEITPSNAGVTAADSVYANIPYVTVEHNNGFIITYTFCAAVVTTGDTVTAGQVIGQVIEATGHTALVGEDGSVVAGPGEFTISNLVLECTLNAAPTDPLAHFTRPAPDGNIFWPLNLPALPETATQAVITNNYTMQIFAPAGTPVYPVVSGTVTAIYEDEENGLTIEITGQAHTARSLRSVYYGLSEVLVKEGDEVLGGYTPVALIAEANDEAATSGLSFLLFQCNDGGDDFELSITDTLPVIKTVKEWVYTGKITYNIEE